MLKIQNQPPLRSARRTWHCYYLIPNAGDTSTALRRQLYKCHDFYTGIVQNSR